MYSPRWRARVRNAPNNKRHLLTQSLTQTSALYYYYYTDEADLGYDADVSVRKKQWKAGK